MEPGEYTLASVDRLLEGWVFIGGRWIEADGCYHEIRSRAETLGDIDNDYFTEVLDLDRALTALRAVNPMAAAVATLVRDGWPPEYIQEVFGDKLRTPTAKLIDKSSAFLRAYMNGATMKEARAAYKRGRRPVR